MSPGPAREGRGPAAPAASNLALRVVSSIVLAPIAIGATWLGGWAFIAFWALAAGIVLWEWVMLVRSAPAATRIGWIVAGVLYAAILFAAPVLIRRDGVLGLTAILFLFAVVWATDIAAYFAGRAIGGPKLWPAVSPKKTWSGALGGALGGLLAGVALARAGGLATGLPVALAAFGLSVASQCGDLIESALKRHFGVKDASQLIPGHGGLLDRLDGFLTAALAAVMVGLIRGGLDAPARGLLIW